MHAVTMIFASMGAAVHVQGTQRHGHVMGQVLWRSRHAVQRLLNNRARKCLGVFAAAIATRYQLGTWQKPTWVGPPRPPFLCETQLAPWFFKVDAMMFEALSSIFALSSSDMGFVQKSPLCDFFPPGKLFSHSFATRHRNFRNRPVRPPLAASSRIQEQEAGRLRAPRCAPISFAGLFSSLGAPGPAGRISGHCRAPPPELVDASKSAASPASALPEIIAFLFEGLSF